MHERISLVREHVTRAVPTAAVESTAREMIDGLRGDRFDSLEAVYVLGGERALVGVVPLTALFAAASDAPAAAFMLRDPRSVRADVDREEAASIAAREQPPVLPVVDEQGRFIGVSTPRAIMSVLRAEHLEDLHHEAGIWHGSEEARRALVAPPLQRARYRLPWLVIGLAGSMRSPRASWRSSRRYCNRRSPWRSSCRRSASPCRYSPGTASMSSAVSEPTQLSGMI